MYNVLINAYAVAPNWGSEQGMGWNWISNLAKYCNLYVVTEGEWQKEIDASIAVHPYREHLHFYYNPLPAEVRKMCWNQGDWRFYKFYRQWQKSTFEIEKKIIAAHQIDLVHHLNMICFREPGFEWLHDLPFVWGPVGGYGSTPVAYLRESPIKVVFKEVIKNIINFCQFRCQMRVHKAMKHSAVVVGAYKETFEAIKHVYRQDVVLINETGAFIDEQAQPHKSDNELFKLIWVGKYDMRKQLGIAIKTMAELKDKKNIHLYVVGTGNEEDVNKYKKMVEDLDLENNVHLLGKVPNDKTKQMMKEMDLFFFTSINDATSTVVPEAISAGLPVVCHDTRGFGVIVNDRIGRKVAIKNPKNSIKQFAAIIRSLESDRGEVRRLSEWCIKRRQEISWDANARKMVELYNKVIERYG